MNRLERLSIDAHDLRRLDEIFTQKTGQGLAAEAQRWRRNNRARRRSVAAAMVACAAAMAGGVYLWFSAW